VNRVLSHKLFTSTAAFMHIGISGTRGPNLTKFYLHITSVVLQYVTSIFVDDIMFAHNGQV